MGARIDARAIAAGGSLSASPAFHHAPCHDRLFHRGWKRGDLTTQIYVDRSCAAHLQPDRNLALLVLRLPDNGSDLRRSAVK